MPEKVKIPENKPKNNVALNHLFPIRRKEIEEGHWEVGKKYLIDKTKDKQVFIIDEIGQFVWKLCDGNHSVREIEIKLIKEANQEAKTIRTSVATFLMKLKNRGYIKLQESV
ncbi:MAG: PqqD family protein [Candidatus Hodarchaeales archaeon]